MYRVTRIFPVVICAFALSLAESPAAFALPGGNEAFANQVIEYDQGDNAAKGYTDPLVALFSPERFTGEGIFPGVVSPFNPPFGLDEIVSIGVGGHLTVSFENPITDDPANPFGIDLLIFGNAGFIDANYPNGIVAGLFGGDGGIVEVSANGVDWFEIKSVVADGIFPTNGYLDSGPYDQDPGSILTNFSLPVDPAITLGDLMGLNSSELKDIYAGSGGGVGIDLADVGLDSISFVRVYVPIDASLNVEIDAFSDVSPMFDPADLNQDGSVSTIDLLILFSLWGPCPNEPEDCPGDLDGDQTVGTSDLLILFAAWS
ncbi:MAG: hypothetical protein IH984_04355 [Planctomycetes bacterium]|nr:hypothetical protein [Planctomycetota bacterium]